VVRWERRVRVAKGGDEVMVRRSELQILECARRDRHPQQPRNEWLRLVDTYLPF
jgi:hypothetical protein